MVAVDESFASNASDQLLSSSVVGDGGASWRLKALARAKEQAAREGRKLDEVVGERWGSLGHLAASISASRAAPSRAHFHATRCRRRSGNLTNSEEPAKGDDPRDGQHAVADLNKFSNDGSFMKKINDLESKKADEQRHNDQKPLKESSNEEPSVSTHKLSANQLSAKTLQIRMKGKHEETGQHSVNLASSAANRRKIQEDVDQHLANEIIRNKQYNVATSIEDEYDTGCAPSKKGKRKESYQEQRCTSRHLLTQKDCCLYCIENPSMPKHLIVAVGNFTYLMLPQFKPVVPGHCVILPLRHEPATRAVDQNVWEEIRNFKKCLLKMFSQQDKDVVFIETVVSLARQQRHCQIECVPVPSEVANMVPMYFKKAIDEAEEEWAQHEMKKLIMTAASRDLRQVIPENFAYFHVEFGLDRGFVHVIEEESKFRAGFGLNVIRGMLHFPEEDMNHQRRHEPMDKQKQNVASFMKVWEPFDWTNQL
ncbi:unnamed protein product [Urochloa decumbens]|uniref:CWF19-like protein 2 n=1 Tax=Urochloa decumbens TaxID=240449 RepID=A0ABC8W3L2_9POAL